MFQLIAHLDEPFHQIEYSRNQKKMQVSASPVALIGALRLRRDIVCEQAPGLDAG